MAKAKKNSKKDLSMSPEETAKKLAALREEIRTIKWKAVGARSKNVKELSVLKKQIARILTRMNMNKA